MLYNIIVSLFGLPLASEVVKFLYHFMESIYAMENEIKKKKQFRIEQLFILHKTQNPADTKPDTCKRKGGEITMKRIQWGAVWEVVLFSLMILFILGGIIFFSQKIGLHMATLECLKHSASVLITLPVVVIFASYLASE